jgi:hypothetical protein
MCRASNGIGKGTKMKKLLSILALLSAFSYAGLGDYLKAAGKSLTETCDKCNAEYTTLDVNGGCSSIYDESKFRRCSAFVENCKCWTRAGDSQVDNEHRAYKFQGFKNELLEYKARVQEQARQDSIRGLELQEQARRDSIRKESERLERAKQDSVRQVMREQEMARLRENILRKTEEMKQLLKANKLQECAEECDILNHPVNSSSLEAGLSKDSLFKDLCENQIASKVKKLPKNKIKTVALARIYYDNPQQILGYIFRDEGKFVWMRDLVWKGVVMVQYSAGYIGECQLRPNDRIPFSGYATYLGDTYTIAFGNVPNYQLLWCGN